MKYFFVTTKHLENKVWFRDIEDYKVGMNAVPVFSYLLNISVLAFILMSNHVHFLLSCRSKAEAEQFINEFKRHFSKYIRRKYGIKELLRKNEVEIQEIDPFDEALERVTAYIQMNCVAANICSSPQQYAWGTGTCFFSQVKSKGIYANSLSKAKRYRVLHTKRTVPEGCLLGEDGYLLPESYVDIEAVERLFRTPKRYIYFLNSSSKVKRKMETADSAIPTFIDPVVISGMGNLCSSLFQKTSFIQLNTDEQTELLKQLRYRFSCNIQQLSRVTELDEATVARMLDRI